MLSLLLGLLLRRLLRLLRGCSTLQLPVQQLRLQR